MADEVNNQMTFDPTALDKARQIIILIILHNVKQ